MRHQPSTHTVTLHGKTGLDDGSLLLQEVGSDEHLSGSDLHLDFFCVEYVSSMDLGALVGLHKRMDRLGGRLVLLNLNGHLREVLSITHLDQLFEIRN